MLKEVGIFEEVDPSARQAVQKIRNARHAAEEAGMVEPATTGTIREQGNEGVVGAVEADSVSYRAGEAAASAKQRPGEVQPGAVAKEGHSRIS